MTPTVFTEEILQILDRLEAEKAEKVDTSIDIPSESVLSFNHGTRRKHSSRSSADQDAGSGQELHAGGQSHLHAGFDEDRNPLPFRSGNPASFCVQLKQRGVGTLLNDIKDEAKLAIGR